MSDEAPYPGNDTTPAELMQLAAAYNAAALALVDTGIKGNLASRAPFRLNAIHAMELYLSAYLRERGHTACRLRGLQHDMTRRTDMALAEGLRLREGTTRHLKTICASREYLITRYDPGRLSDASELTRLSASLLDVSRKVDGHFATLH